MSAAIELGDLRAGDSNRFRRIWYIFQEEYSTKTRYDCVTLGTEGYTYVSDLAEAIRARLLGEEMAGRDAVADMVLQLPCESSPSAVAGKAPIKLITLQPDELVDELPPTVSLNPSHSDHATPIEVFLAPRTVGTVTNRESPVPDRRTRPTSARTRRPLSAQRQRGSGHHPSERLFPLSVSDSSNRQAAAGNGTGALPGTSQSVGVSTDDITEKGRVQERLAAAHQEQTECLVLLGSVASRTRTLLDEMRTLATLQSVDALVEEASAAHQPHSASADAHERMQKPLAPLFFGAQHVLRTELQSQLVAVEKTLTLLSDESQQVEGTTNGRDLSQQQSVSAPHPGGVTAGPVGFSPNRHSTWNVELRINMEQCKDISQYLNQHKVERGADHEFLLHQGYQTLKFTVPRLKAEAITSLASLQAYLSSYIVATIRHVSQFHPWAAESSPEGAPSPSHGARDLFVDMGESHEEHLFRICLGLTECYRLPQPIQDSATVGTQTENALVLAGEHQHTTPTVTRIEYLDSEFEEYVLATKRTVDMVAESRRLVAEVMAPKELSDHLAKPAPERTNTKEELLQGDLKAARYRAQTLQEEVDCGKEEVESLRKQQQTDTQERERLLAVLQEVKTEHNDLQQRLLERDSEIILLKHEVGKKKGQEAPSSAPAATEAPVPERPTVSDEGTMTEQEEQEGKEEERDKKENGPVSPSEEEEEKVKPQSKTPPAMPNGTTAASSFLSTLSKGSSLPSPDTFAVLRRCLVCRHVSLAGGSGAPPDSEEWSPEAFCFGCLTSNALHELGRVSLPQCAQHQLLEHGSTYVLQPTAVAGGQALGCHLSSTTVQNEASAGSRTLLLGKQLELMDVSKTSKNHTVRWNALKENKNCWAFAPLGASQEDSCLSGGAGFVPAAIGRSGEEGTHWRVVPAQKGRFFLRRQSDGAALTVAPPPAGSSAPPSIIALPFQAHYTQMWKFTLVDEVTLEAATAWELCTSCGAKGSVDYDLESWEAEGPCEQCGEESAVHLLIQRTGETRARHYPMAPYEMCTNCGNVNALLPADLENWIPLGDCDQCESKAFHLLVTTVPAVGNTDSGTDGSSGTNARADLLLTIDPRVDQLSEQLNGFIAERCVARRGNRSFDDFAQTVTDIVQTVYRNLSDEEEGVDGGRKGSPPAHCDSASCVLWTKD